MTQSKNIKLVKQLANRWEGEKEGKKRPYVVVVKEFYTCVIMWRTGLDDNMKNVPVHGRVLD